MSGTIEIKNKKKGERFVKQLKKKQTRAKVDAETGITGAGKQMEKMEKQLVALKKTVAGHQKTIDKLWAWKMESEMKDGHQ